MSDSEQYPPHSPGHHHHRTLGRSQEMDAQHGFVVGAQTSGLSQTAASTLLPLWPEHHHTSESSITLNFHSQQLRSDLQGTSSPSPEEESNRRFKLPPSPLVTPPGGRGDHQANSDVPVGNCVSLTDLAKVAQAEGDAFKKKRIPVPHVYHDHGNTPLQPTALDSRKKTGGVTVPFPEKLHEMLESADGPVVCWLPHGRAFCVRKPKEFTNEIMPKYFRQTKLTSFQRQLNLYGFRRITQGTDAGAYYHELFLRGRPTLSHRMVRQKVKGTGHKQPADAASEPNLYLYPQVQPETANPQMTSTVMPFFAGTTDFPNHMGSPTTIDASPGLHGAAHLLHGIAVDMRQQAQSLSPPFLGNAVGMNVPGAPQESLLPSQMYTQRQSRQAVSGLPPQEKV